MTKVSIVCITYNHEKFIAQALESFVSQQTNFEFEALVHDDASTDKTAEIIRKYQKKYPKIIKPIFEKENQYSKGNLDFINDMLRSGDSDYVAFCEGDDYWTDPLKLQKQADYLDGHPEAGLVFHPVKVAFEGTNKKPGRIPETSDPAKLTTAELLENNFIQICSVLYRRQDYTHMPPNLLPGDWYVHLYHAKFGNIGFIDEEMAVYRVHPGGVWYGARTDLNEHWRRHGLNWLVLYIELLKLYEDHAEHSKSLQNSVIRLLNNLQKVDSRYNEKLLAQAIAKSPASAMLLIENLGEQITALDEHSKEQAKLIDHYVATSQRLEEENQRLKSKRLSKLSKAVSKRVRGRRQ